MTGWLPRRRALHSVLAVGALALALALVAVPVLGQVTSPTGTAIAPAAPPSEKPGKGPKAAKEKVASSPVTLTGVVGTRTVGDGEGAFTLTVGGTVYDLEVGPPWFWGKDHPLQALVGKTVTITGEQAEGSTSVDVFTADGTTIREPGKPPWAGGWKAVGEKHPGWAQWKADKAASKGEKTQGRPGWAGPKTPETSDADD